MQHCSTCGIPFPEKLLLGAAPDCVLCFLRAVAAVPPPRGERELPAGAVRAFEAGQEHVRSLGLNVCRFCGCTDSSACTCAPYGHGACYWIIPGVCSECVQFDPVADLIDGAQIAHRACARVRNADYTPELHERARIAYEAVAR